MDVHLITPSDTSKDWVKRHHLVPNQAWANLTHSDTYIHGPFEFAVVQGHKTHDQIDQDDWDALARSKSMFSNPLPHFDILTYSIHVDRGIHTIIPNAIITSHVPHGNQANSMNKRFTAKKNVFFKLPFSNGRPFLTAGNDHCLAWLSIFSWFSSSVSLILLCSDVTP